MQDISDGVDHDQELQEIRDSWSRERFERDIAEARIQGRNGNSKCPKYVPTLVYDGCTTLKEIKLSMKPFEGYEDQMFFKIEVENPRGKLVSHENNILCDRIGYLEGNPTPFENSLVRGKPILVDLCEDPLVMGLVLAFTRLREGETASFMIGPQLGYGNLGAVPLIPPNAWLYYQIKIHKVLVGTDTIACLDSDKKCFQELAKLKSLGNDLFKDKRYREAAKIYRKALVTMSSYSTEETYSKRDSEEFKLVINLLQNMSVCYLKLEKYCHAVAAAKDLLALDSTHLKGVYLLTKAKLELGSYETALHWLHFADKLSPKNIHFDEIRTRLNHALADEKVKRDEITMKMSEYFKYDEKTTD